MTRTGGGASPDVCPRAPDTLATPLEFCTGNCTEWRVSTFDSDSILLQHCCPSLACCQSSGEILIETVFKMRTFAGKRKYLRANCKICKPNCKICELLWKICALQGPTFAQQLSAKAKNCDFSRKGQICAKIAPRKIAIFFRDWSM